MKIDVKIDLSGFEAKTLREQKRIAYNMAESLNNTGKAAQAQIRQSMQEHFKLRSTTSRDRKWLLERIKLTFASVKKGVMFCELYVDKKARLLLAAYETGEQREGFKGKNVAVANPAIAREGGNFAGAIKPELTFQALKLRPFTVTPRTRPDTVQYKSIEGTGAGFRVFGLKSTHNNPLGGVYERVGPGPDDIRLVYSNRRAFKLHELLHFIATASQTMRDKFPVEWAISNARTPSK